MEHNIFNALGIIRNALLAAMDRFLSGLVSLQRIKYCFLIAPWLVAKDHGMSVCPSGNHLMNLLGLKCLKAVIGRGESLGNLLILNFSVILRALVVSSLLPSLSWLDTKIHIVDKECNLN